MDKTQVIKLRDELKCGKNLPVRVLINNSFTIIDESHHLQFTKWDDTNGILYSFRLINVSGSDRILTNKENAISVFAVSYDTIEAIEIPVLPMDDLDALFDGLSAGGCTFGDDYKGLIKNTFTQALHPDRFDLRPTEINRLLGPDATNDKDDYYNNPSKFVDSFKETTRYRKRNQEIIDSQNSNGSGNP